MLKREVGIIVLAAGGARRMGQPKQLLPLHGKPLVYHAVECALGARAGIVLVVLGAHATEVRATFAHRHAIPVENPYWETGISSSIKAGLNALELLRPKITAAVFMLADQPLVSVNLIRKIVIAYQDGEHGLVATRYNGTYGVPALFERRYFEEIRDLPGDAGARAVIDRHAGEVCPVDFPDAAVDVDTPADYDAVLNRGAGPFSG